MYFQPFPDNFNDFSKKANLGVVLADRLEALEEGDDVVDGGMERIERWPVPLGAVRIFEFRSGKGVCGNLADLETYFNISSY